MRVGQSRTRGWGQNLKIGTIRCFETSVAINLSARCNNSEEVNFRYNCTDHDGAVTGNVVVKVLPGVKIYVQMLNSTDKQNNHEIKNNNNK